MRTLIVGGLALSAMLAGFGEAHAYVNYPWCVIGDARGVDCVFATKEQCAQDGRGRGFGGQCQPNPNYNPNLPSVVEQGRVPVQSNVQAKAHTKRKSVDH
jgi:hypothetical protein